MNTNDNRLKAHKLIDHIFQDLLPAHGMAQRPEQIQLSHRMLDAMQDGRIALCDAGTGIGKTYAYLAAATAASAFPTGQIARPIIISTSSIALQNAVLTEYLPLLSCVLLADGILTVRLLKANGIGVYFEKENINTLTESSEFLITLFSGFAQAESESLSKNVAWGKQKSAEAGKVTFQYKKMLGYRKGADGQPEIVPEEAEIIRRIYHRYLDGCTLGQIKRELDEDGVPTAQGVERWSPSIIHNILTNEKYIGDALLQKTYVTDCITKKVKKNRGERTMYYVENSHPAIVSRDLFNQVQQEMTRRSSKRKVLQKSGKTELGKYSGKYALTELLVCGECGSPYKRVTWARNGQKRIVWRCVSRLEFGTKYCQHSPTLDEGKLHSAILAAMNEYAAIRQEVCPDVLAMAEEARQALSQAGARLLQLKKRMDEVSREQSDVLDRLLVNMADTELNARMKALTEEKESLKAQIADAQQAEADLEEQAARRRQMWDSIMECAAGYTEFDNELARQVIQKITVEDAETIRIHFRDSDEVLEQEL